MCKLLGGDARGTYLSNVTRLIFCSSPDKRIIVSHLLAGVFDMKIAAKEIGELWMEYEENSTAEAKIVKDFDKVYSSHVYPHD